MKTIILFLFVLMLASCNTSQNKNKAPDRQKWAIVVHGGAGNMKPENFKPGDLDRYKQELKAALDIGKKILADGGTSLDAVERVIRYLEDCPLFNAGKGAVFTHDVRNELDAAIMDGRDLNAGAIAGVGDIKNPITVARMVMEQTPHVMMIGKGASLFAKEHGAVMVDSSYFYTEKRWKSLQKVLEKSGKMGTVGCVALDEHGNLAAATSTGGMTNKMYGRVGDVPIIGAGTYANNNSCALSATGHGEFFIRYTVTHDISALMQYKGMSLQDAAQKVINGKLEKVDGRGGVIGVDKDGNVALVMNTTGMFRAFAKSDGEEGVAVFK